MATAGSTGYEQNPRSAGQGTVPQGPPNNASADVPNPQIWTQGGQSVPPLKPSATTGPGGPSISIPTVGKSGK